MTGVVVFVLMVLAGSISEVAYFSLKPEDVETFKKGSEKERLVAALLNDTTRLLATFIITGNLSKIAVITIASYYMSVSGINFPLMIVMATATTLIFLYLFEIIIKGYAFRYNKTFAVRLATLWKILITAFRPISLPLLAFTNFIQGKYAKTTEHVIANDINSTIELVSENENISAEEKEILKGILNFSALSVRQIMRPRTEIFAAEISMDFHRLKEYVSESGFSRVPVYRQTLDKVEGVLYIKDLLPFIDENKQFNWRTLIRQALFVPETKKLDFLLKDFQEKHVHMALVLNEHGRLSGLITLEDIIEEIIGDINDEFDAEGVPYKKINEHTFIFEGKTSVKDFCALLGVEGEIFKETKGEAGSLGGLMLKISDEVPAIGKTISFEQFTFVIEAVNGKRIKSIRVHVHEEKESS